MINNLRNILGLWFGLGSFQKISFERVNEYFQKSPKKICFQSTHKNCIRKWGSAENVWFFNVPFPETIKPLCPVTLFKNKKYPDGYYRRITDQNELEKITEWTKNQGSKIFLRDTLPLSMSLDFNKTKPGPKNYTELGNLENRAKNFREEKAIAQLVKILSQEINGLRFYNKADVICAVPPNPAKEFDLPSEICSRLSDGLNLVDITDHCVLNNTKPSIKNLSLEKKWEAWEKTELVFEPKAVSGRVVILIDDKYQSGVTAQFIAMKLQEAGAKYVFGLYIVKTLRDSDNI